MNPGKRVPAHERIQSLWRLAFSAQVVDSRHMLDQEQTAGPRSAGEAWLTGAQILTRRIVMGKRKTGEDRERLRALIEEATVDCYGPEEQLTGLWTMIEDNVVCPFRAKVVGEEVKVIGFEPNGGHVFFATCERKGKKYQVDLGSLEWIEPHPEGFEWIEAYLAWREWNA